VAGGTLLIAVKPDMRTFPAELRREVESAGGQVEGSGRGVGDTAGKAIKLGMVGALAGLGQGLKTAANLEVAEVGFTSLLGSGRDAQKFIAQLKTFARATPFELPGLIDASRQLLGVGVAAEDIVPTLTAFGDASGALGLSQEQFQRVLTATSQAMAKGKLQGEELLQMAEAGIPIYPLLGRALGVPTAAVQDLAASGQLLTADVLPKLRDQMEQEYGGSMAKQAQTLTGVLSTFKDTIVLALADGAEPLADFLRDNLPKAAELAGSGIDLVSAAGQVLFAVLGPLLSTGLSVLSFVRDLPGPLQAVVAALIAWQLGGDRVRTMLGGVRDGVRGFREEMALQQVLFQAQTREAGYAGAAYGTLEQRLAATTRAGDELVGSTTRVQAGLGALMSQGGIIGGVASGLDQIRDRYVTASAGATGFTGRLSAMTLAAGTAARVGIGGLVGALGGPWGIALAAAAVGVGLLVSANQKAAAAEAQHKANVDNLTDALRENNGELTDNLRLSRAKEAQDEGLFTTAKSAGVSITEVTSAINGNDEALDRVITKLRAYAEANRDQYTSDESGFSTTLLNAQGQAASDAADEILGMAGDVDVARAALDEQNEALGITTSSTGAAADATSGLEQALADYNAEGATAVEQGEALIRILDELAGNSVDLKVAEADLQESLSGVTEALAAVDENQNNVGLSGARAALAGDLTSKAARDVQAAAIGAADSMRTQAQAAYDAAAANGDVAAGSDAAGAAAQRARDSFIAAAEAAGLNHDEAVALANSYGLVPGDVVTAITQPGMDTAQYAADILRGKVLAVPDSKTVITSALTADAAARLDSLGYKVQTLPDGTVSVTAETSSADATIRSFINQQRVATIQVRAVMPDLNGAASGSGRSGLANGGRLSFFANGGTFGSSADVHPLTPMRGNWAARVPANTWRVVGDRARGREWYIPEKAPNTLALLEDAAHAHGLRLVAAMAQGGLLGGTPVQQLSTGPGRVTNIQNTLNAAPSLPTVDQLARMQRESEILSEALN